MKKKIINMLICTLVVTATAITATGLILNKENSDINEITTKLTYGTSKEELTIQSINEPDDPQPTITKLDYLSIPATAFTPLNYNLDFSNFGRYLQTTEPTLICCYAPVYLPSDATVTRVVLFWVDQNIAYDIDLKLLNYGELSGEILMAELASYGSGGKGSTEDKTIDDAIINNGLKCYYLEIQFSGMMFPEYIVIEYQYTTFNNSIIVEQPNNTLIHNN